MPCCPSSSRYSAVLSCACAALSGCGEPVESPIVEGRPQAIVYGETSPALEDYAVLLEVPELNADCTGTLVAPGLVLTARHCVSHVSGGSYTCDANGMLAEDGSRGGRLLSDARASDISVVVGSSLVDSPEVHGVVEIVHDGAATVCGHDLAFLVLDDPVCGVDPPELRFRPTEIDESLLAVGWGAREDGSLPTQRMRRAGVRLLGSGSAVDLPASELLVTQAACVGDSGGPLLSEDGSEVVAVTARGPAGVDEEGVAECAKATTKNVYSDVRFYADLFAEALVRADQLHAFSADAVSICETDRPGLDGGRPAEVGRPSAGCCAAPPGDQAPLGSVVVAGWLLVCTRRTRRRCFVRAAPAQSHSAG